MNAEDVIVCPALSTMKAIVHEPEAELVTVDPSPCGAISVGPAHLPGFGPAICLAVHGRDGKVLVATMGEATFKEFGYLVAGAAYRIQQGEFDKPERRQ